MQLQLDQGPGIVSSISVSTAPFNVSAADVRCRMCSKLLLRWVGGTATIDLKCPRCGQHLVVALST